MTFPELRWGTHGTHAVLVSVTAASAAHACTHAATPWPQCCRIVTFNGPSVGSNARIAYDSEAATQIAAPQSKGRPQAMVVSLYWHTPRVSALPAHARSLGRIRGSPRPDWSRVAADCQAPNRHLFRPQVSDLSADKNALTDAIDRRPARTPTPLPPPFARAGLGLLVQRLEPHLPRHGLHLHRPRPRHHSQRLPRAPQRESPPRPACAREAGRRAVRGPGARGARAAVRLNALPCQHLTPWLCETVDQR